MVIDGSYGRRGQWQRHLGAAPDATIVWHRRSSTARQVLRRDGDGRRRGWMGSAARQRRAGRRRALSLGDRRRERRRRESAGLAPKKRLGSRTARVETPGGLLGSEGKEARSNRKVFDFIICFI
jgi:hypothetical protein